MLAAEESGQFRIRHDTHLHQWKIPNENVGEFDGWLDEQLAVVSSPLATGATPSDFIKGGIDFNPNMLNLSQQGQAINFTIDNSMFQNLQPNSVYGIQPVIINITPITNFLPLLGLAPAREEEFEVSRLN